MTKQISNPDNEHALEVSFPFSEDASVITITPSDGIVVHQEKNLTRVRAENIGEDVDFRIYTLVE